MWISCATHMVAQKYIEYLKIIKIVVILECNWLAGEMSLVSGNVRVDMVWSWSHMWHGFGLSAWISPG